MAALHSQSPCATGTAKSELSRRLNSLVGGSYFERLLTRFSVPEELFGPLSMRGKSCCALLGTDGRPVAGGTACLPPLGA